MPGTNLTIRIDLATGARIGPGKIALLEAIRSTGSISGAAREMGMSYKRAWDLVSDLNRLFTEPAVATSFGGPKGGGATLTPFGREVLAHYRHMSVSLDKALADDLAWLDRHLAGEGR